MKVLKLGSTGKEVEDLQKYLKIKVDGDFGPKTEEAVKKFQKENKLTPDGIVGQKTWNAIFSEAL
jgi:peptidoglycan hydrolase-like protein with peptidoglycan-binding domain